MARVAVVGAGVAGLTTAYLLRGAPLEIVVFEKSRGYGGRAATRGRYDCRYDHGAPFFSTKSKRVRRLVTAHLPTDQLVDVGREVWSFDAHGRISRSASESEGRPLWTYHQGISHLGKLLGHFSRAEVRRDTRVVGMSRREEKWRLRTQEGRSPGLFDAVVLTPPAPQTAAVLATVEEGGERVRRVQQAVEAINYTSQFVYVFAYDRVVPRPGAFHALASSTNEHPISWIGFEHDKTGHVPDGKSVILIHTSPVWTEGRLEQDPETFVPEIKGGAEEVLVTDLRHPIWYDVQRWRYARPQSGLGDEVLEAGAKLGLYFAGDYVRGRGRVDEAIESGFDTGRRLYKSLFEES